MKLANSVKLLLLVLCMALMLCACGGESGTQETDGGANASAEVEYKVTVVDGSGNPYTSGVIVQFLQGGEQAAMQVIDENGTAVKTLARGDYTVALMFTGDAEDYHYDAEGLTLSADKTELQIVLAQTLQAEGTALYAPEGERMAYPVTDGSTFVSLTDGQRNYFLFTPTVAGTYEFSTSDENAAIGYYGAPHFVQSENAAEMDGNSFTMSIRSSMIGAGGTGTTICVIGIDAQGVDSCNLIIERIGEPEWTIEDEPWIVYQTTAQLAPYTLSAGAKLGEFDLTASTDTYNLVYNETDGFYHLESADGPLVLVRLGEPSKYLDDFQTILEHSGVVKYFFNADGSFEKKESYSECLLEYFGYMDEDAGVYPLTEDLKYIIQQRGDYSGWWDAEGMNYLFRDDNGNYVPGINSEIAWLFMCCYIEA